MQRSESGADHGAWNSSLQLGCTCCQAVPTCCGCRWEQFTEEIRMADDKVRVLSS